MTELRDEFLKEVAATVRYWEHTAREAVMPGADLSAWERPEAIRRLAAVLSEANAVDDFVYAVRACVEGCAHSLLVTIDGGTALAEKGLIDLVDAEGNSLGAGLHEEMFSNFDE
jgi:hypothetical protein